MPPKNKVTKDEILKAAVDIVRENGPEALNARAVGAKLGISTQPIFSHYKSMDELKKDVLAAANDLYQTFLQEDMTSGKYPPYMGSGIGYIRFAKEEKELFKLVFMRDRTGEEYPDSSELEEIIKIIQKNADLSYEDAHFFHLTMWVYVHGIATMIATSYLTWDWETIYRMMTDGYKGLLKQYKGRDGQNGSN